ATHPPAPGSARPEANLARSTREAIPKPKCPWAEFWLGAPCAPRSGCSRTSRRGKEPAAPLRESRTSNTLRENLVPAITRPRRDLSVGTTQSADGLCEEKGPLHDATSLGNHNRWKAI